MSNTEAGTRRPDGQQGRRHEIDLRVYRRRTFLRATLGAAGVAALAACAGANSTPTVATTVPTPTSTAAAAAQATPTPAVTARATSAVAATAGRATAAASPVAVDGKLPAPAPGVRDGWLRPPPVYKATSRVPGRGGKVTTFQQLTVAPPPPRDQNQYWKELERRLGVTWEPTLVPVANYVERLAAITAGGDLPDLVEVSLTRAPDQAKLIQQGAYTDLTPYLTGDALKEYPNLALYPERVWRNAAIRGKHYGVPRWIDGGPPLLFLRQDWADKVGVAKPQNAEEFLRLLTAFTKGDPDGNGQPDSYGLSATADNPFGLNFFTQVFRVPHGWRRNGDGTLTADLETDEFRQAISYMRRLFEAGVYHPNAATMTGPQGQDAMVAGKLGTFPGTFTGLPQPQRGMRDRLRKTTPPGEAVGLVPFGHDGGKAVTHNSPGFNGYIMIPAKVGRDPERVKELLRIVDYFGPPFGSEEYVFVWFGIEGVHHELKPDGTRVRNDLEAKEKSDLPNLIFGAGIGDLYYPHLPAEVYYIQGLMAELVAIGIDNPALTAYSPTQVTKGSELNQLRIDRVSAIVQGREPLSALDGLIRDWKSRGGDQVRREYEEDLKSR